jgi:2-hydroxy-6-oxonona-2,4-dienedioate hydrolase
MASVRAVKMTRFPLYSGEVLDRLRLRWVDVQPQDDSGAPPLLLLHGLASRIEEYEELIPSVCERRRVIVMDLPGNGYSDKPDRPYTLRFLEDAVLSLADRLDIKEAHLGGGSLGGGLTLRLGHREPQRFTRLVPWAPACAWEPMWVLPRFVRAISGQRSFWVAMWVQSRFWYRRDWPGREEALRSSFAHYQEVFGPGFLRMYWDIGIEQGRTSLFPLAPHIQQPTLLLWGDQDHGLNMGAGVKRLATLLPRARLHIFKGARHSLANEVPQELGQTLDEFLQEKL